MQCTSIRVGKYTCSNVHMISRDLRDGNQQLITHTKLEPTVTRLIFSGVKSAHSKFFFFNLKNNKFWLYG